MLENVIDPRPANANLKDYGQAYRDFSWDTVNAEFSWHATDRINIAHEAIDRHAENPEKAQQSCLIYSYGSRKEKITYEQMRALSNKFGNVLRRLGVEKGDRVFLFLPSIPEYYIALAGCAKIGAVIVPLYRCFRKAVVKQRMLDGKGKVLVTTPGHRERIPMEELPDLEHTIIVGKGIRGLLDEEVVWSEVMEQASDRLEITWVDKEFPLFMIYTTANDATHSALIHPHDSMRGYLMTSRWILDLKDNDIVWTQGQPGWFMHAVYSAFAPWLCGAASFATGKMRTADDIYPLIEENGITVIYTVPAFYRALVESGEKEAEKYNVGSLRHLLSAVHPLYPEVIYGVMRILGMPVYNTWWSAETGMITISNFLCLPLKPGSLGKPCPGIFASVIDSGDKEADHYTMGKLALKTGWPCMAQGVWRNEKKYQQFFHNDNWFMPGHTVFRDADGYYFYQGRSDDVLMTTDGKIGLSAIEKTLRMHPAVDDAGVIRITGEKGMKHIKAFICLKKSYEPTALLEKKIIAFAQRNISADAAPRDIQFHDSLPRDRGGKILRRVLKAWDLGLPVGNIAALACSAVPPAETIHEGK
ncbi:AMP-binding protein [Thermodesulfobacteriota bacterium]